MQTTESRGLVKPMQVRLDPQNYEWLKQTSKEQNRSVNYMVNQVLAQAREEQAKQPH